MASPLDLVASMVLDDGTRWGEAATPEQWADMRALLGGDGPRRHFWLRARGRGKTFDAGAATLGLMLAGGAGGGDEMYAAAAGRDQAALLMRKVRGIAERTPELRGAAEVQNYRLITPRTGAVLDVVSADLASSWGRTPRWLFIDEIANHDAGPGAEAFIESLLTSLPKRADSQCLAATTPSSPSHWSHNLWRTALEDPLWRTSLTSGPAPWQDPAELESERRRLPESLWRRLFLCQWAEADDALADEAAVRACVRHDGPLGPQAGVEYVVSFDLSVTSDHTAAVVAHLDDAAGRRVVVVDRLQAWVPRSGRQVDLGEVEAWIAQAAREYAGAMVAGDPYQAVSMIQRLRDSGLRVKPVIFTALTNSRRAQMLLRVVRDQALDLPDDPALVKELLALRLAEGATPGTLKLSSEAGTSGHHDRVTAVMIAAEELLSRPGGSYLDTYGTRKCGSCGHAYRSAREQCPHCREPNPQTGAETPAEPGSGQDGPAKPTRVRFSGYAAAYLPEQAVRCAAAGHVYDGAEYGDRCPQCYAGGTSFLRRGGRLPGMGVAGGFRGAG